MHEEITVTRSERGTWHRADPDPDACGRAATVVAAERRRVAPADLASLDGVLCSDCFRTAAANGGTVATAPSSGRRASTSPASPPAGDVGGAVAGPAATAVRIDEYLDSPPVALSDPLTAVTGVTEAVAARYADPTATESYFGRYTSVETVGELLCSDASIRGVAHSWTREARWDLLSVPFGPDDAARIVEDYRERRGDLARLFGAPSGDDPVVITDEEATLLRHCTAFGYRVTPEDVERPTAASIGHDRVRDETYRHITLYRRSSFDVMDAPLSTFDHPRTVSSELDLHGDDVVLLTTAPDLETLADAPGDHATTHLRVDRLITASLLLGENFARPGPRDRIHFRTASAADRAADECEIYCVFEPADDAYCYGLSAPLDGDLSGTTVARLVREELL